MRSALKLPPAQETLNTQSVQQPATEDPALTDRPLEEPDNTNLPHHYPNLGVLYSPALADTSGVGSWQDQAVHPHALADTSGVGNWHNQAVHPLALADTSSLGSLQERGIYPVPSHISCEQNWEPALLYASEQQHWEFSSLPFDGL